MIALEQQGGLDWGGQGIAGTMVEVKDVESWRAEPVKMQERREEPRLLCAPPRHPITDTCKPGAPFGIMVPLHI